MNKITELSVAWQRFFRAFNRHLDTLLYGFSAYATPFLILVLSLVAVSLWPAQYPVTESQAVEFSVVQGTSAIKTPQDALVLLQNARAVKHLDTKLSPDPFWVALTVPKQGNMPITLELPSRHTTKLACWQGARQSPLGQAIMGDTTGVIESVKAGYAINTEKLDKAELLVCSVESVGPARIAWNQWNRADLQLSAQEFQRKSGLLDGGVLILAMFVLITALINRSGLYLVFAAWLVLNLRMGALSFGWDTQWLGYDIPDTWLLQVRGTTTALYYTTSITLFATLFREQTIIVGCMALVRVAQWISIPLLGLSFALPLGAFLPYLWVATGLSIAIMSLVLTLILIKTRSPVAMWYGASVSITIAASLFEVLAAALGFKGLIGSFNSVTAAVSSSLLAALAISAQLRQEHEQRLQAQAEREHTFEAMPIGLFSLDLRGRFVAANPALKRMLSPRVLEHGGHVWQRYFSGGAWAQLHNLVHTQNDGEIELRGRTGLVEGGDANRYLVKATLARDRIEGSMQNITEKAKATEELLFLVNNDPLTKVLNRRGIEKSLGSAMADLTMGKPLALAYLDLDRFRLINDLYGHNAGDEVLQQVCERVSHMISGAIQFGRVGGDEFVLVMPDTKIPVASLICRGIIESLGSTPYRVGDRAFHVRGSMGLIEVSTEMQVKDAVSTADRACHDAKQGKGDGLVVYERNAKAFDQHDAEMKLVERLATSSVTDGLFVMMQPIMSLSHPHASLNFEVLLRMMDTDGKLIPTDRLIAAAETSGRMGVIDRWVLTTTLKWLNDNQHSLKNTRFVCMNLSGASLNDEKFLQDVFTMLDQNINVVRHLCLEITESVALHDLNNTRRFVDRVRSFGAKVALDDFGAGYTSFSYLKELTADLLKIDGSFIVNMNRHPANVAIVEAIVSLARNLGMKTIAEWAEDAATVQTLIEIGVDYVQGYIVARPQMPEKLLTVSSSAGFIVDEDLAAMIGMLDDPEDPVLQVDLFEQTGMASLH